MTCEEKLTEIEKIVCSMKETLENKVSETPEFWKDLMDNLDLINSIIESK